MKKEDLLPLIPFKDFSFNENILVFLPRFLEDKKYTYVIENHFEYVVNASPKRLVNKCCATFGTSFKDATKLSQSITKAKNKLPISFGSTKNPFVMFPTLSPNRDYTIWVSYSAVIWYDPEASSNCEIQLGNQRTLMSNISSYSLQRQLARSLIIFRHYQNLNMVSTTNLSTEEFTFVDRHSLKQP